MSSFYTKLNTTVNNTSVTENGMVGYKTTTHALADFNYKIASYRSDRKLMIEDLDKVIAENDKYLLKFLFYVRDIREGVGERGMFRLCIKHILTHSFKDKDKIVDSIITNTPEFGRYDDLLLFLGTKYESKVIDLIKSTLKTDFANYKIGEPITLLAKWLPSANASSKTTRDNANTLIKLLGTTPKEYRKTLSTLRAYLNIVEVKACKKEWSEIDYNAVPSRANLLYNSAFLRNDEERRREFLAKLAAGDKTVKINSSVNFPHDIVHQYSDASWGESVKAYDETLEQLWKNLKSVVGLDDTVVVRDDSGSMTSTIGGTKISALEVATALGIYCAEHCSESYKNRIITFSGTPRYLDFSDTKKYSSLHNKLDFLYEHNEVANTNIQAVFELILKTAVDGKISPEDMPKQILIISDMEFDGCAANASMSVFKYMEANYKSYGYAMPKLAFWNVNSRTGTIPVITNDRGVSLISGFSQNVLRLVMSGKTDPYEALIDELSGERYSVIPEIDFKVEVAKEATEPNLMKEPDFLK